MDGRPSGQTRAQNDDGQGKDGRHENDLDAQADELLQDIEAQTGSMYAVHAGDDAEEFDPGNLHAGDLAGGQARAGDVTRTVTIDEPPEGLDHDFRETTSEQPAADGDDVGDAPAPEHRGLKRALVLIIVVLVLIVCAVGVLVWHNSITPNAEQADTEELATNQAGTDQVDFQKVDADKVPGLSSVFGLKLRAAEKRLGNQLEASGKPKKTKDRRVKKLKRIEEGAWRDANGDEAASAGLGLDKKGRVVYAYVLYNLDTIDVAESSFAELVKDDTVADSVLSGTGVTGKISLGVPKLNMDDSTSEQAVFTGKTRSGKAPKTWELSETYTYGSDNSTTRTLLVELY